MTAKSRIGFKSRLGLGGSGLGTLYRDVSERQAEDILIAAYDSGLRYFDTAPFYGYGLSELRLGRFLRTVPRDSFTLSTKVGRYLSPPFGKPLDYGSWARPLHLRPVFDYSYDGTMRAFEQSASRLGFSDVDILYIHDVDRFTHGEQYERRFAEAMDGCYRALSELRAAGHVRAIGIGINESDVAARFLRAGEFDVALIAGRYTLLDQAAMSEFLPEAARRGVEVVAGGVFNSGILAAEGRRKATYDYKPAPREIADRVETIRAICAKHHVSVQAIALQFPLAHPSISAILVGMDQPDQAMENLRWSKMDIPADLWAELKSQSCLPADAPVAVEPLV